MVSAIELTEKKNISRIEAHINYLTENKKKDKELWKISKWTQRMGNNLRFTVYITYSAEQ